MGIGKILDRALQLYRNHFKKLFIIMLILYAPFYFLQTFLLYDASSLTVLPNYEERPLFSDEFYEELTGEASSTTSLWKSLVYALVLLPVFLLGIMPVSIAAVVKLVQASVEGRATSWQELLRGAFRPFGRLVGGTVLFGLIMIGIYIVLVIAVVVVSMILVSTAGLAFGAAAFEGGDVWSGVIAVVFMVLFGLALWLGIMAALGFFLIRFGFYLPLIVEGTEGIGFGRSWALTRMQFLRVFAAYLIFFFLSSAFVTSGYAVYTGLLGSTWIGVILQALFGILLTPVVFLVYAVMYFDLRVRNEAYDVEIMLEAVNHDAT